MSGYILLEGGAEFGGRMAEPDLRAIELAGGANARLSILPTAAAPDNNHLRAGQNGLRWFHHLGSRNAAVVSLFDQASAAQPEVLASLKESRLIYLLGGFPGYLYETLANSPGWQAILSAYQDGAVIAGSSAGAMILCERFFDPESSTIRAGLNLIPHTCLIPHHNKFGKDWAVRLSTQLTDLVLVGIDEETGIIDDGDEGMWNISGAGSVTIYQDGNGRRHHRGESFHLSI